MYFYKDILESVNNSFDILLKKDLSFNYNEKRQTIEDMLKKLKKTDVESEETKDELEFILRSYAEEKNQ